MFELTMNDKTYYYVDGFYYTIDTIPIINLFDTIIYD